MKNKKPQTKLIIGTNEKGLLSIPYDRTLKKTKLQNLLKDKFNQKSPKIVYGKDKNPN